MFLPNAEEEYWWTIIPLLAIGIIGMYVTDSIKCPSCNTSLGVTITSHELPFGKKQAKLNYCPNCGSKLE